MVTKYHNNVENGLVELGRRSVSQRRIKKVCRGSVRPLSIVDSRSKYVVNYKPDVYFVLRNNKKLIFEVLDSELGKQDIIIADVIRSFLVENVDGLFFIYPGPESAEQTIFEALITVYMGLVSKGVDQLELPNPGKIGPYVIEEDVANNIQALAEKLNQYAQEEKWFKSLPPPRKR